MIEPTNEEHLLELERILAKLDAAGMAHAAALVAQAIDTLRAGEPLSPDEIDGLESKLWAALGGRA